MRRGLTGAALLLAIVAVASGCGGSHRLPAQLLTVIRSNNAADVTGRTVDVYGPNSRNALVQAAMGDSVGNAASEQSGFYLIVYHGHFENGMRAGPPPSGTKPPQYKVQTNIWSAKEGFTDQGLSDHLPDLSSLGHPTVITLKR